MASARYHAILDVYALLATYPAQAQALRELTEHTALAYLRRKTTPSELKILLRLARDLGYVDAQLHDLTAKAIR